MRISIITVCYNSVQTLEETICSVLNQKYEDKEYIIIDGGSTDGTKNVIDRYKNHLAYWCSESDRGLYDAMNKGIHRATGDVVAFLNSDDWYEDGVLSRVNRYFEDMDIDMLSGDINNIIHDRIISSPQVKSRPEDIRIKMIYPHQALFAKREIFKEIGNFDLKYKIASDYDWILRAYIRGAKIKKVNDVFTNCREGGISFVNACECLLEQKRIALQHLNKHTAKVSLHKVDECYAELYKDGIVREMYYKMSERDLKSMWQVFPKGEKYYIWGTGIWGERCYWLFKRLDFDIIAFIDTYKKQDTLHGVPIIEPEEIGNEGIICISSRKYENEIIRRIQFLGIKEERYFCFFELALEEGLKKTKLAETL